MNMLKQLKVKLSPTEFKKVKRVYNYMTSEKVKERNQKYSYLQICNQNNTSLTSDEIIATAITTNLIEVDSLCLALLYNTGNNKHIFCTETPEDRMADIRHWKLYGGDKTLKQLVGVSLTESYIRMVELFEYKESDMQLIQLSNIQPGVDELIILKASVIIRLTLSKKKYVSGLDVFKEYDDIFAPEVVEQIRTAYEQDWKIFMNRMDQSQQNFEKKYPTKHEREWASRRAYRNFHGLASF